MECFKRKVGNKKKLKEEYTDISEGISELFGMHKLHNYLL